MKKLNFNMLDEIVEVAELVKGSRFEDEKLKLARPHIRRLQKAIDIGEKELIYFCVIFRENLEYRLNDLKTHGQMLGFLYIAEYLGVSITYILKDYDLTVDLFEKRLYYRNHSHDDDLNSFIRDSLIIPRETFLSVLHNEPLVFEKPSESNCRRQFLGKISNFEIMNSDLFYNKIWDLEEKYKDFEFMKNCKKISRDRHIFFALCALEDDERLTYDIRKTLSNFFSDWVEIVKDFSREKNYLRKNGYIEVTADEFCDNIEVSLTDKALDMFFGDEADWHKKKDIAGNFVDSNRIKEKELFYDERTEKQVRAIEDSLTEAKFSELRKRLANEKMNTGICTLFYGEPGTGKTEAVKQIAKATGRAVFHVDISEQKSCWFGESEKLIKKLFKKYNLECERARQRKQSIPILLFNEADAILSKRKNVESSNVAQTENAIQNIILENLENFEGIMIATTNLAENFDKAFERRFLFKVKFEKPTAEIASQIWKSKLSDLKTEEATELAANYDFSGGEIDNISRKVIVEKVITGEVPTFEKIRNFCSQEKLELDNAQRIGFAA